VPVIKRKNVANSAKTRWERPAPSSKIRPRFVNFDRTFGTRLYVSNNLKDQCPFHRLDERKPLFGRQFLNMPKQGKVRKGTHSCRECRRRKVKCVLEFPTDGKCVPCQRRGSTCTSQSVVDSSMTSPGIEEYTGGFHDQSTIITDDDRDTQSATPALALHGRPEVGEQHPSFPGIRVPRV
jgi:hypothetical protein